MDAINILQAARAKIARPEDWGKGPKGMWVTWAGKVVKKRSIETYCAAEAIDASDQPYSHGRMPSYRAILKAADAADGIIAWNDAPERTHAEVLAAFDLAIATLLKKIEANL